MLSISALVDNPNSWIVPYARELCGVVFSPEEIPTGDILFILGCEKILPQKYLDRNTSNVVIHPSGLPKGRGFSPLAWQVLEGKNSIPVTLFEAWPEVDAGPVYLVRNIELEGTELNDEIKRIQGENMLALAREYVEQFPMQGIEQRGQSTWYPRRTPADSELDPNKTIAEQFDLLRVVDNERYPAFFDHRGSRYVVHIHAA